MRQLCDRLARILQVTLAEQGAGRRPRSGAALDRPASQGAGDITFGIDVPAEDCVARWHEGLACLTPVSVMTEDVGWRHLGPQSGGGWRTLDSFDHGGPRIAFDPIDGTRNLMANMRSGWTVVSFAEPGAGQPSYRDLTAGILSELPTTREGVRRILSARRGGVCTLSEVTAEDAAVLSTRTLSADRDDRPDNGYFPFFRYQPALRPAIATIEADFLRRLVEEENADEGTLYDDQYITNAGQMVLVTLGTYRVFVDPRPLIAARLGVTTTTAKPYDVGGAFVVAEATGAVVTDLNGEALDFPIDCVTPIAFAGWANAATRKRLLPHLRLALAGS